MKKKKVIYYKDELNDDFAGNNIEVKSLPKNFKHVHHNPIYKLGEFFVYYVIAKPIIWVIMKFGYLSKIRNKKVLKSAKKTGYFIYGNHTGNMPDAFQPNLLHLFKKNYVVVGPAALSITGLRTFISMLGAIPLGTTFDEKIQFLECIRTRIKKKSSVMIYPEKHIWPYYTDIRPFENESFRFPVSLNVPCFALTTTFHKRRGPFAVSEKPKLITFLDGPFYPDLSLKPSDAKQKLRDDVYNAMKLRATQKEQYKYIEYIKEEISTENN